MRFLSEAVFNSWDPLYPSGLDERRAWDRGDWGEILVDEEFRDWIPAQQSDEAALLEENLVREGVRDCLVMWPAPEVVIGSGPQQFVVDWQAGRLDPETGRACWLLGMRDQSGCRGLMEQTEWPLTVVDGHHRLSVAQRHGLPFRVTCIPFGNRADVREWMLKTQLGRRNLPDAVRIELALRLAGVSDEPVYSDGVANLPQAELSRDQRRAVAEAAGVSERTVGTFRQVEKAVAEGDISPEEYQQLKSGKGGSISGLAKKAAARKDAKRAALAKSGKSLAKGKAKPVPTGKQAKPSSKVATKKKPKRPPVPVGDLLRKRVASRETQFRDRLHKLLDTLVYREGLGVPMLTKAESALQDALEELQEELALEQAKAGPVGDQLAEAS